MVALKYLIFKESHPRSSCPYFRNGKIIFIPKIKITYEIICGFFYFSTNSKRYSIFYPSPSLTHLVKKFPQSHSFFKKNFSYDIAKKCFTPELRSQLIILMTKISARRPRMALFEN